MNFPVSRKASVFLLAGVVGVFSIATLTSNSQTTALAAQVGDESPLIVETLTVSPIEQYSVTRRFIGRVEASRESDLGFELSGMIDSVEVDEGTIVSKGASVARLNTELLEARRQELIASRDRAKAQLALADSTLNRIREASALDAVSTQSLDEAKTTFANTQAAFAAADSAVNTLSVQIRRSEILAPFDAIVAQRFLDEGRVVAAGEPVVRLLERSSPEVRLSVAESSASQLVKNQNYSLLINGNTHTGTLKAILPQRQSQTRGIEAIFILETEFGMLRSGDLAEVALIEVIEQQAFQLPITALTESARGIWAVYVAEPTAQGHVLNRRQLEVLHQEGDNVIVRGTLSAGESIVSAGLQRLMPGQQVTLMIQPVLPLSGSAQ